MMAHTNNTNTTIDNSSMMSLEDPLIYALEHHLSTAPSYLRHPNLFGPRVLKHLDRQGPFFYIFSGQKWLGNINRHTELKLVAESSCPFMWHPTAGTPLRSVEYRLFRVEGAGGGNNSNHHNTPAETTSASSLYVETFQIRCCDSSEVPRVLCRVLKNGKTASTSISSLVSSETDFAGFPMALVAKSVDAPKCVLRFLLENECAPGVPALCSVKCVALFDPKKAAIAKRNAVALSANVQQRRLHHHIGSPLAASPDTAMCADDDDDDDDGAFSSSALSASRCGSPLDVEEDANNNSNEMNSNGSNNSNQSRRTTAPGAAADRLGTSTSSASSSTSTASSLVGAIATTTTTSGLTRAACGSRRVITCKDGTLSTSSPASSPAAKSIISALETFSSQQREVDNNSNSEEHDASAPRSQQQHDYFKTVILSLHSSKKLTDAVFGTDHDLANIFHHLCHHSHLQIKAQKHLCDDILSLHPKKYFTMRRNGFIDMIDGLVDHFRCSHSKVFHLALQYWYRYCSARPHVLSGTSAEERLELQMLLCTVIFVASKQVETASPSSVYCVNVIKHWIAAAAGGGAGAAAASIERVQVANFLSFEVNFMTLLDFELGPSTVLDASLLLARMCDRYDSEVETETRVTRCLNAIFSPPHIDNNVSPDFAAGEKSSSTNRSSRNNNNNNHTPINVDCEEEDGQTRLTMDGEMMLITAANREERVASPQARTNPDVSNRSQDGLRRSDVVDAFPVTGQFRDEQEETSLSIGGMRIASESVAVVANVSSSSTSASRAATATRPRLRPAHHHHHHRHHHHLDPLVSHDGTNNNKGSLLFPSPPHDVDECAQDGSICCQEEAPNKPAAAAATIFGSSLMMTAGTTTSPVSSSYCHNSKSKSKTQQQQQHEDENFVASLLSGSSSPSTSTSSSPDSSPSVSSPSSVSSPRRPSSAQNRRDQLIASLCDIVAMDQTLSCLPLQSQAATVVAYAAILMLAEQRQQNNKKQTGAGAGGSTTSSNVVSAVSSPTSMFGTMMHDNSNSSSSSSSAAANADRSSPLACLAHAQLSHEALVNDHYKHVVELTGKVSCCSCTNQYQQHEQQLNDKNSTATTSSNHHASVSRLADLYRAFVYRANLHPEEPQPRRRFEEEEEEEQAKQEQRRRAGGDDNSSATTAGSSVLPSKFVWDDSVNNFHRRWAEREKTAKHGVTFRPVRLGWS